MQGQGKQAQTLEPPPQDGRGLLSSLTSGELINEVSITSLQLPDYLATTLWAEESCLPAMEHRVRVKSWVEENRAFFQPPVCNKLM